MPPNFTLASSIATHGLFVRHGTDNPSFLSYDDLFGHYIWSDDLKTWHRCGVESGDSPE